MCEKFARAAWSIFLEHVPRERAFLSSWTVGLAHEPHLSDLLWHLRFSLSACLLTARFCDLRVVRPALTFAGRLPLQTSIVADLSSRSVSDSLLCVTPTYLIFKP